MQLRASNGRESAILEGVATEETVKILILVDAVRCPAKLVPSKMNRFVDRFYDHLARLIYAEVVSWMPTHLADCANTLLHYEREGFVTTQKVTPLGYLSDQETKVGLLNNEAITKTIVRLIKETADSAATIGVHVVADQDGIEILLADVFGTPFPDGSSPFLRSGLRYKPDRRITARPRMPRFEDRCVMWTRRGRSGEQLHFVTASDVRTESGVRS